MPARVEVLGSVKYSCNKVKGLEVVRVAWRLRDRLRAVVVLSPCAIAPALYIVFAVDLALESAVTKSCLRLDETIVVLSQW